MPEPIVSTSAARYVTRNRAIIELMIERDGDRSIHDARGQKP
jgi:hypothetical protein